MKNEKLARKAYKDYELELQKEKDLQKQIDTMEKSAHQKAETGEIVYLKELVEIYDKVSKLREELEKTKRNIDILARLIVRYVFG